MFLQVEKLAYRQGNRVLFHDLSFCLNHGELLWVKGDNGAGKTTLLKILAGYYTCYKGQVRWAASGELETNQETSQSLLYIGHENGVHSNLSVIDNLKSLLGLRHDIGWIKDESVIEKAIYEAGLQGLEDTFARSLSAGQKKRIALSQLVMPYSFKLWILDEPFTALDSKGVAWLNRVFESHINQGGMIILTSHQLTLNDNTNLYRTLELGRYRPETECRE